MRALLFFVFIILIFVAIRFTLKRINQISAEADSEERESAPVSDDVETMVACEVCQVNLPKSEALVIKLSENAEPHFACSEAHLKTLSNKLN